MPIYRGFEVTQLPDGRWQVQHGRAKPEACASEDDAMAYVDAHWRRKRQKVDAATREAITGRREPVSSQGEAS